MRRLDFLEDEPWDEVEDDQRVRWFGHPSTKGSSLASSCHVRSERVAAIRAQATVRRDGTRPGLASSKRSASCLHGPRR
jgi:hypothetical protein